MAKVVVFDIGNGSFEEGFPVTLSINEEGKPTYFTKKGKLPPAPEIPELHRNFQQIYRHLPLVQRIITVDPAQPTNFSTPRECKNAADALEESLRIWCVRTDIIQLRQWVQEEVHIDEPARVIFQTDDEILKKLPLHQWELFQNRPKAWLALGADNARPSSPLRTPVRILTILGNTEGLNVDIDTDLLNQLPGAKIEILRNTTRRKLCETLRNEDEPWDILYFAGHSSTKNGGNDGVIQISDIDSLSLGELRNAFKKAIQNGLKLAIFNSCDGLGLANRLAKLGIPQVIVMREPVPDEVAHEFLQEFLRLFSQGERFYTAVRQAQEKLEDIENDYPCASWLPIICQNPAENSLLWPQPLVNIINFQKLKRKIRILWHRRKWAGLVIIGILLSALIPLFNLGLNKNVDNQVQFPQRTPEAAATSPSVYGSLEKYFSHGGKSLFNEEKNTIYKKQGISEFKNGKWDLAIQSFTKSLKQKRNDPETLIYLNNAIALKSGNKLQIAVSVPISTNFGGSEEILRGVAHAQSEINCNGVDNIKKAIEKNETLNCTGIKSKLLLVEIVNESDKKDSSLVYKDSLIEISQKIAENQDILAVIGHDASRNTIEVVNNAYQDKLVIISPTSTSNELDKLQYRVYRTAPSDSSTADILYEHASKRLAQSQIKASVIYDSEDSYSNSLKKAFKKRFPQPYSLEIDLNRSDFDSINFDSRDANLILLIPSTKESIFNKSLEVVSKVSKITTNKPIFLSADSMYEAKLTKDAGESAQKSNLVLAVPWHRSANPSNTNFENDADKLWPYLQISWRTAMAYDSMKAIIEGLKNIPDSQKSITRENLKTEFSKMLRNQYIANGASAPIRFTDKGSRLVSDRSQGIGILLKVECRNKSQNYICDFEKLNE
ncbi:MAG: CHAT domain-containing protein [Calothrix sp. FI2-JRJ7]|jgi:branched-chain amino acid transport system substrate-binding protein|nr:CHAT domain-containing protein [Calothrix sp. FI2-JRJ7]